MNDVRFKIIESAPTLVRVYAPDGSEWEVAIMLSPVKVRWEGVLNPDGSPLISFENAISMGTRMISAAPRSERSTVHVQPAEPVETTWPGRRRPGQDPDKN